jgi:hypothetical protein
MANTDDTSKKQGGAAAASQRNLTQLEFFLEAQRRKLLQAHSVMHCLYEVLLYAEGEDAVTYAEAAHLASMLVDDVIEQLDSARLQPLIEAIKREGNTEGLTLGGGGGDQVREPNVFYFN